MVKKITQTLIWRVLQKTKQIFLKEKKNLIYIDKVFPFRLNNLFNKSMTGRHVEAKLAPMKMPYSSLTFGHLAMYILELLWKFTWSLISTIIQIVSEYFLWTQITQYCFSVPHLYIAMYRWHTISEVGYNHTHLFWDHTFRYISL